MVRNVSHRSFIVVAAEADIERFGTLVGTILQPALSEGIIIYERV